MTEKHSTYQTIHIPNFIKFSSFFFFLISYFYYIYHVWNSKTWKKKNARITSKRGNPGKWPYYDIIWHMREAKAWRPPIPSCDNLNMATIHLVTSQHDWRKMLHSILTCISNTATHKSLSLKIHILLSLSSNLPLILVVTYNPTWSWNEQDLRILYYKLLFEHENDQMQGLKVNLIMTDYCMPGMSGYDLLKRVKVNNHHPLFSLFLFWLIPSHFCSQNSEDSHKCMLQCTCHML